MSQRIKQKRLEMNLTQEELAEKLGLQKSAIAKYENGRVTNIKREIIKQMAALFDCSPAWLMGFDSEVPTNIVVDASNDAEFFKKYLALTPAQKEAINQIIDQFS